jgi:hypothetical protein
MKFKKNAGLAKNQSFFIYIKLKPVQNFLNKYFDHFNISKWTSKDTIITLTVHKHGKGELGEVYPLF